MANPVAELLKEIVIYEHRGSIYKIAELAGLAHTSARDHLNGRTNPSVEVIKAAWLVTRDPRLKKLLEPDGYELVPVRPARPTAETFESGLVDLSIIGGDIASYWRQAIEDGIIDPEESRILEITIDRLTRAAAELKALKDQKAAARVTQA